ncbi:MAG: hypothetical protein BWY25_02771 [Chloroflexi bacterium ADurb.Bin222]|nr:MAG: hypothetical protein BWY25_02771 [Chloroflexi bacterium ADurb.Bin222]
MRFPFLPHLDRFFAIDRRPHLEAQGLEQLEQQHAIRLAVFGNQQPVGGLPRFQADDAPCGRALRRIIGAGGRYDDVEFEETAPPGFTHDRQFAAHHLHELPANGQPQAGALLRLMPARRLDERLEDACLLHFGNANAGIFDLEV